MSPGRKRTATQHKSMSMMIKDLEDMEIEMKLLKKTRKLVPDGWGCAEMTDPCKPKKTPVTLRLEPDVLDWYRNLGFGYQNRINTVLRCYMHGVISKHLEGEYDRDWLDQPI